MDPPVLKAFRMASRNLRHWGVTERQMSQERLAHRP
jgi:hypothetical protein